MQVRHEFGPGALVLVQAEGHPHWPAKVQSCLKNGGYRVVFFGEKSEAAVLPQALLEYCPTHVNRLRRGKQAGRSRPLQEAIRLAERVVEERSMGNFEFEEEALMGRRVPTRRRKGTPQSRAKESALSRSISSSSAGQTSIPAHREVKNLLDKLIKHCASFDNAQSPPLFTPKDEGRLAELLSAGTGMALREVIDQWVLERMILALRAIEQWGAPSFEDLCLRLRERYSQFAQAILSEEFHQVPMEASRKERTIQRVRQCRVDVQGKGDHDWGCIL